MMKAVSKIVVITLFTLLTTMLLVIDYTSIGITESSINVFIELNQILKNFDIIHLIIGIFIFYFYYQVYYNDNEKFTKKNIIIAIISVVLATIITIGKNIQYRNEFPNIFNLVLLMKSSILFFGSYFAFYALIKKISLLDIQKFKKNNKKKLKKKQNNLIKSMGKKIITFFDCHPIISSFILIILCRIPYMIIYFPFSATGDTYDSLCQFFNNSGSWSKDMVNLVNPNVYLNSHHPVFYTLILGSILKIGYAIHSFTLGAFLYTILQTLITTMIFSFVIYYMKRINIPFWIRMVTLLLIAITPVFSSYTILAVKDTPSAIFTLLYSIFLIQIIRNYNSIYDSKAILLYFVTTMLFVLLFRNNGLITILLSYPFLFILYKKHWKKLLLVLIIPIVIFFSFNQIMYRCFDVSKGSKKELFSIPFMQIARVVNDKGENAYTKKDKKIIDNLIGFKNLGTRYTPNISDYVKDGYKKSATNKDLKAFFKVWFKYLCKYPNVYIKSVINSTYQYFYPNEDIEDINLGLDMRVSIKFSVKDIEKFSGVRTNIYYIFKAISKIPLIGLLFHVACFNWILLISTGYVIYKKKYKYLIALAPYLSVLLVCLASPLNGSFRYILPIIFGLPAIIIVNYLIYKDKGDIYEETK